eukprot:TRINITY_DN5783_c0_g2_i1.p1 TRINITY_DN5783_c0_g2~~TRINITY_DN5783_c0_g2_i1.p1  ORF type:complete len:494 (+),score=133.01 TRINITY_DN5783_c0_g2_i1:70-1551(+)
MVGAAQDPASARVAEFLSAVAVPAEHEWAVSGGAVAERLLGRDGAGPYREAFVAAQAAGALDAEAAAITEQLRHRRGEGEPAQSARSGPPGRRAPARDRRDDTSDCSAVQRELVERNVREGKPEVPLPPGSHAAGGGRHVCPGFADRLTCGRAVAAATVALGRGFRRKGQSSVGIFPCLAERLAAVHTAPGELPPLCALYLLVERMRRRVAECFAADPDDVRISDAQIARLQPFDPDGPPPADGWDVGALRGDRFCYWRPHIDQVSVTNFEWSSLLYLTEHGTDFSGGRFVMHDEDADHVVLPAPGTLVAFPSGRESVHSVERVTEGLRFAVTAWFTRRADAYAAAPPEHLELLSWARAAVDAGAGEPPPPPPGCAAARGQLCRQPELALTSAAICTLPANDPLLAEVVAARSSGEAGAVGQALEAALGHNPARRCHWHSLTLAETPVPVAPPPVSPLLQQRVPAVAALLRQLQPAAEAAAPGEADPFGGVFD